VEVVTGVMERECIHMNRRFFTFHTEHRPWVILKWAQTADGMMGMAGERLMITGGESNRLVHRWRTEEDAILVGTETALQDDPQLTARHWPGKNPLRVVLDLKSRLPKTLKLFSDGHPTLVLHLGKDGEYGPLSYRHVDPSTGLLKQINDILFHEGIQSLIVEGGVKLLKTFLDAKAWDEVRIFRNTGMTAPGGVPAPDLPELNSRSNLKFGTDELVIGFKIWES
jgi:diaminohydroxyphosphoribosylaminopyrimidine deaminase/5-amino-6-(5-phosphoribosylamino)uracil reductase